MPIYEFECSSCGHRFDHLQKLSDTDPTICPACQAAKLHRRVSAPFFRLAGSGWYETDFKKDGEKKRNIAGDAQGDGAAPKVDGAKPAEAKPAEPKPAVVTPAPGADS
ncbi:MAG: FmdB family zinc ribbon protein [Rhodanobacter sp.]